MVINVATKVFPATVKALGVTGTLEIIGAASLGAGIVSFAMDKGTDLAKKKLEDTKQKLEAQQAAKLNAMKEQKAMMEPVVITEEEKPEVSKKKK